MASRSTRPSAQKRPRSAAPLDAAERALRRLITTSDDLVEEAADAPATEEMPAVGMGGTGTERPVPEWVEVTQSLQRYFAFIDVCGFTAYTDREGTRAAIEVLTRFRADCRDVTGRRGVRVIKWLGDGAMLVGTAPGPVIAAAGELLLRFVDESFDVHGGVAGGTVLLFEGDDYIGRSVNLAARLCEAAAPGELLCHGLDDHIPDWVERAGTVTVRAMGIGDIAEVAQLRVGDDAWAIHPVSHHPSVDVHPSMVRPS
jgi:class 3 adenylate cyclase